MTYNNYCRSRNAAWDVLVDQKIAVLPVRIAPIMENMGITLQSYTDAAPMLKALGMEKNITGCDAYTLRLATQTITCYDDEQPTYRIRYTLAHELGHLCMGHIPPTRYGQAPDISETQEQQANTFAARLLSPACVLWGLGLHTAYDISSECGISMAAAKIRTQRMALLYAREENWLRTRGYSCFCHTAQERQIYQQFAVYIGHWTKRVS